MILLVDIGNSRVKWAVATSGADLELAGYAPVPQNGRVAWETLWSGLSRPDRIVAASVVGGMVDESLTAWASRRWNTVPEFAASERTACGVVNGYHQPDRLGVDRWAAVIAGYRIARGPVCIADCGTAVTVDVVGADGVHLGGVIAPGSALMTEALASGTERIGLPDGREYPSFLGRDTSEAVALGTRGAIAGLLERTWSEAAVRLGCTPARVITGGDAPHLHNGLPGQWLHRPLLVLEGLAHLAGLTTGGIQ